MASSRRFFRRVGGFGPQGEVSVWSRDDFEYELRRLSEEAGQLERWLDESRPGDLRRGLRKLRLAHGRLLSKLHEHCDHAEASVAVASDVASAAIAETDTGRRCVVCGEAILLGAILAKEVSGDPRGWYHQGCQSAPRGRWPRPSRN